MGKIVVVAEKPSVGRDIARVLGCRTNGDGCLTGEKYIVTWAVGHLVTLVEPDELDPKYEKWSFSTLPILPETIPLKVISSTKDQFGKVKKLINDKETDSLICATDWKEVPLMRFAAKVASSGTSLLTSSMMPWEAS